MRFIFALIALGIASGLGWQVYRHSSEQVEQNAPPVERRAVAVEVMSSRVQPLEERAELAGSLEAVAEVLVVSRVAGYITELPFDVGEFVPPHELVVQIDDREQQEQIRAAQAALAIARAQLKSKQAEEKLARTDLARLEALGERGVTTNQELEQARARLEVAAALVELELSRVKQAESELERFKLALNDTEIDAPMAGFVAERLVDVGDLAKPDVPLLRIVKIDSVRTVVHVPERDYEKVRIEQQAAIEVDAFPGKTFRGRVVRKAPALNPNTRTAAVHIDIPNPEQLLKPGMHARVNVLFQRLDRARVIPVAALVEHNDRPAVFVVEGDPPQTRLHEVEVGINDGEVVEVLSGLAPDARVVTLGSRLVKHAQQVRPIAVEWPKALASGEGAAQVKPPVSE